MKGKLSLFAVLGMVLLNLGGCVYDNYGPWRGPGFTIGYVVVTILVIIAVVDVLRTSADLGWKVLWILLIIVLPVLGLILYFLLGRRRSGGL